MELKLKKSAGVRVTTAVHRLIAKGNAARGRQDWGTAATAYDAALAADPSLGHIWIQLGHALKEADRLTAAMDAYAKAQALRPNDSDPAFFVGELSKRQGDMRAAVRHYLAAARATEGDPRPIEELAKAMGSGSAIDSAILAQAVRHEATAPAPAADPAAATAAALERIEATAAGAGEQDLTILRSARAILDRAARRNDGEAREKTAIVFDVTDLVAHFRNHRLPTGIQRVQIEVVTRAMARADIEARICCFVDGRETLLDIPTTLFAELAYLSTAEADGAASEWLVAKTRLFLHLFLTDGLEFRQGDTLLNLGTSWWIYNYYLLIRNAKRDFGIRYIPFVHDLIPIMATEHCVAGVVEDYVSWLVGVFDHADLFLANSESTARDLIQAAGRLGRRLGPEMVEVVHLNADFRTPARRAIDASGLARWGLAPRGYCLLVSTIESRKNHLLALEAWSRLIERHGADAVPRLVCVGRSGWLNTAFFERLDQDWTLRGAVSVIERVSDEELALLYQNCLFTLYPSHYEGWGLPVTESLCYGRVPVVADNSSLPEAAAGFGILFESNSPSECVNAVETLISDDRGREAMERRIVEEYRPRGWSAITDQIMRAVIRTADAAPAPAEPAAITGVYYPVSLYKGLRIWRGLASGEVFRAGTGWLWPEPNGCRTTADGGELLFRAPDAGDRLRLYLRLRGLDQADCGFVVETDGHDVVGGDLEARGERWVLADVPVAPGASTVTLHVRGDAVEEIDVVTGGTLKRREASIAVLGFGLVDGEDMDGRVHFVEGAALGDLGRIDAYGERGPIATAMHDADAEMA